MTLPLFVALARINTEALERDPRTPGQLIARTLTRAIADLEAKAADPDAPARIAWDTLTVTTRLDTARDGLVLRVEVEPEPYLPTGPR